MAAKLHLRSRPGSLPVVNACVAVVVVRDDDRVRFVHVRVVDHQRLRFLFASLVRLLATPGFLRKAPHGLPMVQLLAAIKRVASALVVGAAPVLLRWRPAFPVVVVRKALERFGRCG